MQNLLVSTILLPSPSYVDYIGELIHNPKVMVNEKEDMGAVPMSSPFRAEAKEGVASSLASF